MNTSRGTSKYLWVCHYSNRRCKNILCMAWSYAFLIITRRSSWQAITLCAMRNENVKWRGRGAQPCAIVFVCRLSANCDADRNWFWEPQSISLTRLMAAGKRKRQKKEKRDSHRTISNGSHPTEEMHRLKFPPVDGNTDDEQRFRSHAQRVWDTPHFS